VTKQRWNSVLRHSQNQPPVHILNTGDLPAANHPYTQLAQYYPQYAFNAFYMKTGFVNGGHDYAAEEKNNIKRFGWGYVGDGYHNTTRYGELEQDVARKQSLGVVMRNWVSTADVVFTLYRRLHDELLSLITFLD